MSTLTSTPLTSGYGGGHRVDMSTLPALAVLRPVSVGKHPHTQSDHSLRRRWRAAPHTPPPTPTTESEGP